MDVTIDWRPHITHDPGVFGGKATIAGTRFAVDLVLRKLADGETAADILQDFLALSGVPLDEDFERAANHLEALTRSWEHGH